MATKQGRMERSQIRISVGHAAELRRMAAHDLIRPTTLIRQLLAYEMRDDAGLRALPRPDRRVGGPGEDVMTVLEPWQTRWLEQVAGELGCTPAALARALLTRALECENGRGVA